MLLLDILVLEKQCLETQLKAYNKVKNLEERIKQLFADVLQVSIDQIVDITTPDSLEEWDSLNHLNLIATFEEEFSIDIEPEDIPKMMESYSAFKSFVQNKIG